MSQRIKVSASALHVGAFAAPLSVRRIKQARRIQLHLDPPKRGLVLTLPRRAPLHLGLRFVREKALWAQNRLALLPKPVTFRPGARLPVAGLEHVIVHRPDSFGGVWRERGMLIVTGRREHVERRIADLVLGAPEDRNVNRVLALLRRWPGIVEELRQAGQQSTSHLAARIFA